jgi:hypothetical protein
MALTNGQAKQLTAEESSRQQTVGPKAVQFDTVLGKRRSSGLISHLVIQF